MKDQIIHRRFVSAPFRLSAVAVLWGVAGTCAHAAPAVTLTSSASSIIVGQGVTLTGKATNGTSTISGAVTFKDGGVQLPGSPINANKGVAMLTVAPLTTVGVHNYTASYTFTAPFYSSTVTSSTVPVTVNKAAPTLVLGAMPAATVGAPVDLSAQLSGGYKPGGAVTFTDTTTNTSTQGTLDATGKATVQMTLATSGAHSIKASYGGDGNNVGVTSTAVALMAKNALVVNLASDTVIRWTNSATVGLVATLNASPQAGAVVKFMDSVNGASPVQLGGNVPVDAARQAKATVSLSTVGKHVITAVYAGDALTNSANSAFATVTAVAKAPADAGSDLYKSKVYVDAAAPTCVSPSSPACGSADKPYRSLPQAFAALVPSTELIVAGRDGFAYYVQDDGALPAVSPQQTLALRVPNFPGPNTVQMPIGDGRFYTTVDVAKPSPQPDMAPTLVRQWAGAGLGRPVVRGSAKVGGWRPVAGGGANLYSVAWSTKAEGLDAYQDSVTGAWKFPTTVRPQQMYRDAVLVSGQPTVLEQVGGVLFNEGKYVSPPLDGDPALAPWPEKGIRQRPIGRVPPVGNQPWLNLGVDQFYVDAPLNANGSGDIDKSQPVTLYARLASPLAPDETLEVGLQQFLLDTCSLGKGCAANLTIKDLVFERSNGNGYSQQNTAVTLAGENLVMDNVILRRGDAICLTMFGPRITFKNSIVEYCGQTGITASGSGHTIDNNKVRYNNAKGFNENWAAGGMKFISPQRLTQSTVSNNEVSFNDGPGIWLDTTVDNLTISGNTIGMNGRVVSDMDKGEGGVGGFGVHLEVVNSNKVANNVIVGNANSGVHLIGQASSITGNFIAANMGPAISRPVDSRLPCPSAASTGNLVTNNDFVWNDEVVHNAVSPEDPRPGINFTTLQRMVGDVSDSNRYCNSLLGLISLVPDGPAQGACGLSYTGRRSFGLSAWRADTALPQNGGASQDVGSVSATVAIDQALITQLKNRDKALWAQVLSGDFKAQAMQKCSPMLKP